MAEDQKNRPNPNTNPKADESANEDREEGSYEPGAPDAYGPGKGHASRERREEDARRGEASRDEGQ